MTKKRKTPMEDEARKARNTRKREAKVHVRGAFHGQRERKKRARVGVPERVGSSPAGPSTFSQPAFQAPAKDSNADAAVATLLADSFAAHTRALTLRRQKDFFHGDEQLTLARDKRREAHGLDPEHTAPAWVEDAAKWRAYAAGDVHKELLAFYDRRLDPPKETE